MFPAFFSSGKNGHDVAVAVNFKQQPAFAKRIAPKTSGSAMLPIYVSKHLRVKPEVALSSWTRGSIKYARMTQREADVSVHQSMGAFRMRNS